MDAMEILKKSGIMLLEQNDSLIEEREAIRKWLLELGTLLDIVPKSTDDISVADSWVEYRKDIMIELRRLKKCQ